MGLRAGVRGYRAVGDILGAVLLTAVVVAATAPMQPNADDRSLDALAYLVMVVAAGAVAGWRRWPVAVVVVVGTALAVYVARGYPGGPVLATGPVALHGLAARRERCVAYGAAAALSALVVVVALVAGTRPGVVELVVVGWSAAAVLAADAVRSRRERLRQLEETRELQVRRRMAEERLGIARDLHDSVAHSMAVINVQSGVAAHVIGRHPDRAREALETIRRTSGEVLDELTALLGLLRVGGDALPREPPPGVERVAALVASTRGAGLDVALSVIGAPSAVPQPVGAAVYRIVQESLTNVARHAGPARAAVTIACQGDGGVRVEVTDDGRGADGAGTGSRVGLRGMRERAEATGGRLEAGPRSGGGFAVTADWPGRP